ncbi:class I SAM-dependent methyltransferase [Falsiroseomonas tokyonensis]|uniref:Class I SAM-dependent methyltransferase n=1 Tax=Falsiroseomonas tokyonensis TaxID=430521 RepID=A0ABV7BUA5_9PROT|nr:class I SAM-dependent methyltransferase [Falsiroseomonas tokyonensis]MBU8538067.1 class I SAM-dependent methyltransferase [Falsiroseomonas tokyonensis]
MSLTRPPQPPQARPAAPQATPEDVRAAYRMLLGREPENEAVVLRHLASKPTRAELRARFVKSDEFRRFLKQVEGPRTVSTAMPLAPDPVPVEVHAEGPRLAAMLQRVGSYWARVGQEAPHWSVLTNDRFRPENIAENRKAFYATGAGDLDLVRRLLARHGIDPASLPRCLEYGCGVGRATLALASLFQTVVGCDISQPHLDLAQREAEQRGLTNIRWHASTMQGPMPSGQWDLWYSRIVLQHNPPPVIAHLLRLAFAGLAPGGVAIFQVPTHRNGYAFAIDTYMAATGAADMEMHMLPQREVFALAAAAGLEVLEVREDAHVVTSDPTLWLSNMFVLRRPGLATAPMAG